MAYQLLPQMLHQEAGQLRRIDRRWMPQHLLMLAQVEASLRDMSSRYDHLSAALVEIASLDRADIYLKLIRRMRYWVRQAHFVWKGDQLTFLRATAGFYSDFGAVLRLLKQDSDRGKFASPTLGV